MSQLVKDLQPIGRLIARRVLNTPDLARHLDARMLGWVLSWDHQRFLSVRSYIARMAGNEARRFKALSPAERTEYLRRWAGFYRTVSRPSDELDNDDAE